MSGWRAFVGVSDHAGYAILVSARRDGAVVDRRRIELVDAGLPAMPHHHDAKHVPMDDGVALVEAVARSARACAGAALERLAAEVPIAAIALRACPPLPPTIAERITSYRASNVADWVMYREALAAAAAERGWAVHWFEAKQVFADAAKVLGKRSIAPLLRVAGAAIGPPWRREHQMAMAAAIAAGITPRTPRPRSSERGSRGRASSSS